MKRTTLFVLFAAALVVCLTTSYAWATPLVQDTFTYPDGNLAGNTPPIGGTWIGYSSAGSGPMQVSGGTAQVVQNSTLHEDDSVPFAGGFTATTGTVLYAGFDVTIADPGGTYTPEYFSLFLSGTSNFLNRIWVEAGVSSGFDIVMSNGSSITAIGVVTSSDLSYGTTYRIVSKYDYTAKQGTIWIDPVTESSTSATATDAGFSDPVGAYAFRQATPTTGSAVTEVVDNLAVGTTFADAVTVPEPASFVLAGLSLVGLVSVARRRKVA